MKYQDFVIKNGKLIGKFDEMYQKFPDPWNLLKKNKLSQNINYQIILNYCNQIKKASKMITLEIGCGYPQISNELNKNKFKAYGTDISETVIKNLKENILI